MRPAEKTDGDGSIQGRDLWGTVSGVTLLFVHDDRERLAALQDTLTIQRISFNRVRHYQEALEALDAGPDRWWSLRKPNSPTARLADILHLAAKARQAVSVRLALEIGNVRLYEDAMERSL